MTARGRALIQVESPYLLEPEAAAYLRVSPRTLRDWRSDGLQRGPRYREHGGVITYAVKDLNSWSDARARLCTTTPAEDRAPEGAHPSH